MVKHSINEKSAAADERRDSKFKGVRKRKWGKWVSEIRLPNSRDRIWLGSYDSAVKAARAFDAALFCLRGRTAKFNFPDNPPEIAGGRSLSPSEIQAAAARFANSEQPPRKQLEHSLTDQSVSELQVESPCPSVVSDLTAQMDSSELMLDIPFLDLLANTGSGNYPNDYGLFPGFDDLSNDFFAPLTGPSLDFGEENFDGVLAEDSFLWNF
uniref:AP2/ERF domain-containing transcription factor n=2 Tax=Vernicia TaxID=73153 RepID=A0A1L6CAU6_9ROSI|nr:AP2/ERF domain-containing transcription factor [Vernicia montana]APQ47404.1 AP2/ERF domain-containing transcription factor [Vernicia fordii]